MSKEKRSTHSSKERKEKKNTDIIEKGVEMTRVDYVTMLKESNNSESSQSPSNKHKMNPELLNILLDIHLWPMLEREGWKTEVQETAASKDGNKPKIGKNIYIPPNVHLDSDSKVGEDFFDSKKSLLEYLRSNSGKASLYVRNFLTICHSLPWRPSSDMDESKLIAQIEGCMQLQPCEISDKNEEKYVPNSNPKPQRAHSTIEDTASREEIVTKQPQESPLKNKCEPSEKSENKKENKKEAKFIKRLPRFLGASYNASYLLFPSAKVKILFEDGILSDSNSEKSSLNVKVEDSMEDPTHTVLLTAKGRSDLIKTVEKRIREYLRGVIFLHNLFLLLEDPESIVLQVNLRAKSELGLLLFDTQQLDKVFDKAWAQQLPPSFEGDSEYHEAGVWIDKVESVHSELLQTIPLSLIHKGACILQLNGKNVRNVEEIKRIWNEPRIDENEFITVTLCLSKLSDMSKVNVKHVTFPSSAKSLKLRNGSNCAKWRLDSEKGFVRCFAGIIPDSQFSRSFSATQNIFVDQAKNKAKQNVKLNRKNIPIKPSMKEFSLIFDPFAQLGFYCVTITSEKNKLKSRCKIVSVNPKSLKDKRLKPGIFVTGLSLITGTVVVIKTEISSHSSLQKHYLAARKRGKNSKLRISFVTDENEKEDLFSKQEELWNDLGWLGKNFSGGWAGGAAIVSINHDSSAIDASNVKMNQRDAMEQIENQKQNSLDKVEETLKNARQALVSSESLIGENIQKQKSNFELAARLCQASSSSKKRVSFASEVKTFHYDPSPSNEVDDTNDIPLETNEKTNDSSKATPKNETVTVNSNEMNSEEIDMLSYAVKDGDFKQVVQILKGGKVNPQDKDSSGKTSMEHVDELTKLFIEDLAEVEKLDKTSITEREMLAFQLKDLEYKKKLLKIFIHSAFLINNVRFIEDWIFASICVKRIENVSLSKLAKESLSSPFVYCTIRSNGQKQGPDMPKIPISNVLEWEDPGKYTVRYNAAPVNDFTFKTSSVEIKLNAGSQNSNILLGSASIPMARIKSCVEQFSKTKPGIFSDRDMTVVLKKTSNLSNNATVTFNIRRLPDDQSFIVRKREDYKKKLEELILWIQEFMKETSHLLNVYDPSDFRLDYNISTRKSNGVSLLHAAIYLGDKGLVRRLLDLGADVHLSTVEGTAIELSASLVEMNDTQDFIDVHKLLLEFVAKANKDTVSNMNGNITEGVKVNAVAQNKADCKVNTISTEVIDSTDSSLSNTGKNDTNAARKLKLSSTGNSLDISMSDKGSEENEFTVYEVGHSNCIGEKKPVQSSVSLKRPVQADMDTGFDSKRSKTINSELIL